VLATIVARTYSATTRQPIEVFEHSEDA